MEKIKIFETIVKIVRRAGGIETRIEIREKGFVQEGIIYDIYEVIGTNNIVYGRLAIPCNCMF